MVERFQLTTYLLLTLVKFFSEHRHELKGEWSQNQKLLDLLTAISMILGSEFVIDWIKHAFVIKFNRHSPLIYGRFLNILSSDLQQAIPRFSQHPPSPLPSL